MCACETSGTFRFQVMTRLSSRGMPSIMSARGLSQHRHSNWIASESGGHGVAIASNRGMTALKSLNVYIYFIVRATQHREYCVLSTLAVGGVLNYISIRAKKNERRTKNPTSHHQIVIVSNLSITRGDLATYSRSPLSIY